MERLKNFIDTIDKEIVNERNGRPLEDTLAFTFMYGSKQVFVVYEKKRCEIEILCRKTGCFLDNVSLYAEGRVIEWKDIEVYSEWDANGFRNEDDFITYKYR